MLASGPREGRVREVGGGGVVVTIVGIALRVYAHTRRQKMKDWNDFCLHNNQTQ